MKQEMIVLENSDFGQLRMLYIDGKEYFVANDVAKALGYSVPKDAVARHCKGALKQRYLTEGGEQEIKFIPEGDVYRLIIRSKLPKAEEFEKWVFDEVLPSIRKTGGYINGTSIEQIIQRTVTETIQAVVPEVMKVVMSNIVPFLLGQQKAVTVVKTAEKENESLENEKDYYTYETDVAFHLMGINKIELFPEEMLEQVNGIMEGMRREQKLNCNLIARFCKNLGYPVSKETVKEYFEKKFLKG